MTLTPEQQALFDLMETARPKPTGGQTTEQAEMVSIRSFQYACSLEFDAPDDAEVREAIAAGRN